MKDPKETMRELLGHLKKAEKELAAALSLFAKFPSGKSKNGAKRMDRLIDALICSKLFNSIFRAIGSNHIGFGLKSIKNFSGISNRSFENPI